MENIETKIVLLKKEIDLIKQRNKKVEAEKAWETSIERKVFVAIVTYIVIFVLMVFLQIDSPHINALIPTGGYLLSTLSIGFIKKIYIKKYIKKRG